MKPATVTLIGRAHDLAFIDGEGTWTITVNRAQRGLFDFKCVSDSQQSIDAFKLLNEGSLIGVIAEVPPARHCKPGAPLLVQRLELLGKPAHQQEVAG